MGETRKEKCGSCDGSGRVTTARGDRIRCPKCLGKGQIIYSEIKR